jgi:hypothetical protein
MEILLNPQLRRRLGLILTAAPVAIQALVVALLSVNTILWDEFYYVDMARDLLAGRSWWHWLPMQHNEHRLLPTKLVMAPVMVFFNWDTRVEMYVSVVLAGLAVLGLWRLYRRLGGSDLLLFAPVAWIVFWRWLFYWINRRIADAPIKLWMGEFSMITRLVRDAILKKHTSFPFLRAEMGYVGYQPVGIPYLRASRARGTSHYNFLSMTRFAVAGFLSSSTFPLRGLLYVAGLFGVGYLAILAFFSRGIIEAAAWAAVLSFFFLILSLPMIGVYLARTYKDVSGRPVFFIDPAATEL